MKGRSRGVIRFIGESPDLYICVKGGYNTIVGKRRGVIRPMQQQKVTVIQASNWRVIWQ